MIITTSTIITMMTMTIITPAMIPAFNCAGGDGGGGIDVDAGVLEEEEEVVEEVSAKEQGEKR